MAQKIPDTYPGVTAHLIVRGAAKAVDWYGDVFGARERLRLTMPDGGVAHCELEIGRNGLIMIGEESPQWSALSPAAFGGSPVTIAVFVEDADATVARAVAAGARLDMKVETQFYGDRSGRITDPFGHVWNVATHVEDMSTAEMQRRFDEMLATPQVG